MIKVIAVKNGEVVGWFKDLIPGINCIKESCKVNGFNIQEYEIRDFENRNLLWTGEKQEILA